jgi:hypothetical protein
MEFFKRVTEALVLESDEDDDEDDEFVRGEDATRNGGAPVATSEGDDNDDDDTDEIKALMSSAFSFTRGALATIKQATHEVSNELKESFKDIKAQVEEDLRAHASDDDGDSLDAQGTSNNSVDDDDDVKLARGDDSVMYTSDGMVITTGARGDEGEDEDEDDALDVQDTFEQVGEKIELLGQKMFQGAGQLANLVKVTTREAIEETRDVLKETRDAFAAKEIKTPRREKDEFETRLQAIQRDSGTYTDEPENSKLFDYFTENFSRDLREKDITDVLSSNNFMKELFARIVPGIVDEDAFWCRYFFNVYALEIEFGRKLAPNLSNYEDSVESTSDNVQAEKPKNFKLDKVLSHDRIETLATDEEDFDSDESLAKEDWTKIKPTGSHAADSNNSKSPRSESEVSIERGLDDEISASESSSDEDEDWGLK